MNTRACKFQARAWPAKYHRSPAHGLLTVSCLCWTVVLISTASSTWTKLWRCSSSITPTFDSLQVTHCTLGDTLYIWWHIVEVAHCIVGDTLHTWWHLVEVTGFVVGDTGLHTSRVLCRLQWGFLDNYPLGGAAAIEVILFPFMPAVTVSVSVPPFSLDTTVGP